MELRKIKEGIFYIPNPVNIGVLQDTDDSLILIDTGLDKNTGKKISRLLRTQGFSNIKAIINTHSHADHIGANKYIKEEFDSKIYAPSIEAGIIEYPVIEPLYLFSGAKPLKELESKFLMAPASTVDYVIQSEEKYIKFNGFTISIVPLPGHALNQIGLVVDNVLFCADTVFSKEVLVKHKIPFNVDIDAEKTSLKYLIDSEFDYYLPSHAKLCSNIAELSKANLDCINEIENWLFRQLETPKSTEGLISEFCSHFNLSIELVSQYYLTKTAILAYLSSLHRNEKIKYEIKQNSLKWSII